MTLKELFKIAKDEMSDFSTLTNPDFRLEQAEYKSDENIWELVVSYLVENTNKRTTGLGGLISDYQYHRMYKKLKIDNNKKIVGFFIFNNKE